VQDYAHNTSTKFFLLTPISALAESSIISLAGGSAGYSPDRMGTPPERKPWPPTVVACLVDATSALNRFCNSVHAPLACLWRPLLIVLQSDQPADALTQLNFDIRVFGNMIDLLTSFSLPKSFSFAAHVPTSTPDPSWLIRTHIGLSYQAHLVSMSDNYSYRRIAPAPSAPAASTHAGSVPANPTATVSASGPFSEKEAETLITLVTDTLSKMLDVKPPLPAELYALQVELTGLLKDVLRGEAEPRIITGICDTITAVLEKGDVLEPFTAHYGEGNVKLDLMIQLKKLLTFALRIQRQQYKVLVRQGDHDGRPSLDLEICAIDPESGLLDIWDASWVNLAHQSAPSDSMRRFKMGIERWIRLSKPGSRELWYTLRDVKGELNRIRSAAGYEPSLRRSPEEVGYHSLRRILEHSVMSEELSEGSQGDHLTFALCMSERDGVSETEQTTLLSGHASQSIAEWLRVLLPIISELLTLLRGDTSRSWKRAKQHIEEWWAQKEEGGAVQRLASYAGNGGPSSANDYENLMDLVKELRVLCSQHDRHIPGMLASYVSRKKLAQNEKDRIEHNLDHSLRELPELHISLPSRSPWIRVAGLEDPIASNSFWTVSCLDPDPKPSLRTKLPKDIASRVVKSEGALTLLSSYNGNTARAERHIGTLVSHSAGTMLGSDRSRLASLKSEVDTKLSQVASGDILSDIGDVPRQDVCILLSAVQSSLSSVLSLPQTQASQVEEGTRGAANSLG
jgi:hypothetical protein